MFGHRNPNWLLIDKDQIALIKKSKVNFTLDFFLLFNTKQ
jgi:hypothetical protein